MDWWEDASIVRWINESDDLNNNTPSVLENMSPFANEIQSTSLKQRWNQQNKHNALVYEHVVFEFALVLLLLLWKVWKCYFLFFYTDTELPWPFQILSPTRPPQGMGWCRGGNRNGVGRRDSFNWNENSRLSISCYLKDIDPLKILKIW